jgi:alanyl-tRNA synthetase
MISNPKVDSALHVLKGAAEKIINTPLTTGVYADGSRGRLTVEYEGKPTEEQMQEIERLANKKIEENVPIEILHLKRSEAEKRFGSRIYDKFPVPAHIQNLTIVHIEDWNVNCCIGQHLKTTGEISKIHITDYRARTSRKELEISFEVM